MTSNPKKFWGTLNPQPRDFITLSDDNGCLIPDEKCCDIFNIAFASVFVSDVSLQPPPMSTYHMPPMDRITISVSGIVRIIDSMNSSSACGLDNINIKVLKNTKLVSAEFLALIFSQSLDHGIVPSDWRLSKIIPIFKKGNKNLPLNYRPIALTSVPSKILEHILFSAISAHLESSNYFSIHQHGFRKGYSCETQLSCFVHDLQSNLDVNVRTDTIFLDFSKAFDSVNHSRLLYKLSKLNIDSLVLTWIDRYLCDRSQATMVNGCLSSFVSVRSGVPQGSVLGPLLFLIFINDLSNCVSSSFRLFADDCVIYRSISSSSDSVALQRDLNLIHSWCCDWLLFLNVSKCSHVSFTRSKQPYVHTYTLGGSPISKSSSYKYLGVHLSFDLTWTNHINTLINETNRKFGFLRRHLKFAPSSVKILAYTTLLRPKLEYASSVWDPHLSNLTHLLEAFQNRAARFISNNFTYPSSISSIKHSLGLPDLYCRRKFFRLCLFHKFYYSRSLRPAFFSPANYISPRLDHPFKLERLISHSAQFSRSFFPYTIIEWNCLPSPLVAISDFVVFRRELVAYLGL